MPQSLYPSVRVVREFHLVLDVRFQAENLINSYNYLNNKFLEASRLIFFFADAALEPENGPQNLFLTPKQIKAHP